MIDKTIAVSYITRHESTLGTRKTVVVIVVDSERHRYTCCRSSSPSSCFTVALLSTGSPSPSIDTGRQIVAKKEEIKAQTPKMSSNDEENLAAEIRRHRLLLRKTQETLKQLESEHMERVVSAQLLVDASRVWHTLTGRERRTKSFVLRALKSDIVPDCLSWRLIDDWFPRGLRQDRDIFLARLDLDDFEEMYCDRTFQVPKIFRNDKEIMLKVVSKNSGSLEFASSKLQGDRDVVLAAVTQRSIFAPCALRHASTKLQGDKRIARTILEHDYGIRAFKFLSPRLQDDYNLALLGIESSSEACSKTYEHLSELPPEMLEDDTIVLAAVQKRGSNLRFAHPRLQDDIEIVLAACVNDGASLQYCPKGPTRKAMLKEPHLTTVLSSKYGGGMLEFAPKKLRMQSKYLMLAVDNGMYIPDKMLAELYEEQRSLYVKVLRRSRFPYSLKHPRPGDTELGLAFLANDCLAGTLAEFLKKDVPTRVLKKHMKTLIMLARADSAKSLSTPAKDDFFIMLALCKADDSCYEYASPRLKKDVRIAKVVLQSDVVSLKTILAVPKGLFATHHELACLAIKACDVNAGTDTSWPRGENMLFNHFGEEVLSQKDVILEWVRRGWQLPALNFRELPRDEAEPILLETLKHLPKEVHTFYGCINRFSNSFRRDKAFLKKAVRMNTKVISYPLTEEYFNDFDLMLAAVASSRKALQYFTHKDHGLDKMLEFATLARERLALVDGFVTNFLGGISIPPAKRRRGAKNLCHLPLLDFGYETGAGIKGRIAEFAGIPMGPELKLLRPALENLKFWGY